MPVTRGRTTALLAPFLLGLSALTAWPGLHAAASEAPGVLVYTRAASFVHESIPDGVAMIERLGAEAGWIVTATDESTTFNPERLAAFDVIVFLSTTGDVLDEAQQDALRAWVENGGGFVGIHAAADTEHDWPWFGTLLGGGARFVSHPDIQPARVVVERPDHSATGYTVPEFRFTDEWYNFSRNPREAVEVILTLDESSYDPGDAAMGDDHPIAWTHRVGGGRSFYTGLGHRSETYADPAFQGHILSAVSWAAGTD